MDVYVFTEVNKKVKGEDTVFLEPLAELADFESEEAALEALVDEAPDLVGTEFVVFTVAPSRITVGPVTGKYSFSRADTNGTSAEPVEEEEQDEEPEEEAPKPRRTRGKGRSTRTRGKSTAKKTAARKPANKPAARSKSASKPAAAKTRSKPAAAKPRAGTRSGSKASGRKSPFTANPNSAE